MRYFLLLFLLGCAASPEPAGKPVRIWTLKGKEAGFADLLARDRKTLVVFMTVWCPICKAEQPEVERFAREESGYKTIYMVVGSSLEGTRRLVRERNISIPVFADAEGTLADSLGITAVPALIVFAPGGERQATHKWISEISGNPEISLKTVLDEGEELGTTYEITLRAQDEARAREDLQQLRKRCRDLEDIFSEWKEDSEISILNRTAGKRSVTVSEEMAKLLQGALHVARSTRGAFDPTWRPLGELWREAGEAGRLPSQQQIEEARRAVGWEKVSLLGRECSFRHGATRLGIAGVAKGWIIDALFWSLRDMGYEHFLVNIGGDLRASGMGEDGKPWRFRIANPFEPEKTAGMLDARDVAMATSGNYFRFREIDGQRVGHILDPRTGLPPDFEGSVTVITRDAAMADALATALFIMGPDEGLGYCKAIPGVDAVYATREGLRSSLSPPASLSGSFPGSRE